MSRSEHLLTPDVSEGHLACLNERLRLPGRYLGRSQPLEHGLPGRFKRMGGITRGIPWSFRGGAAFRRREQAFSAGHGRTLDHQLADGPHQAHLTVPIANRYPLNVVMDSG